MVSNTGHPCIGASQFMGVLDDSAQDLTPCACGARPDPLCVTPCVRGSGDQVCGGRERREGSAGVGVGGFYMLERFTK